MQNFFATNLTTWSVGALQSYGSGTTERSYFVCTNGTHEVLVSCPNGESISYTEQVEISRRTTNDNVADGALGFSYARGGGFTAAFVTGDLPYSDASFWPTLSTHVKTIDNYNTSNAGLTFSLYLIENDDYPELLFYVTSLTNLIPAMWGFSSQMFDSSRVPVDPRFTWATEGVYGFDPGSSTSGMVNSNRHFQVLFSDDYPTPYYESLYPGFSDSISPSTSEPFPIDGTYLSRRVPRSILLPSEDYGTYINYDRRTLRQFPDVPAGYGKRYLGDPGEVFVFLNRGLLLPWASNLGDPSMP